MHLFKKRRASSSGPSLFLSHDFCSAISWCWGRKAVIPASWLFMTGKLKSAIRAHLSLWSGKSLVLMQLYKSKLSRSWLWCIEAPHLVLERIYENAPNNPTIQVFMFFSPDYHASQWVERSTVLFALLHGKHEWVVTFGIHNLLFASSHYML